jgi:hypothetical protein
MAPPFKTFTYGYAELMELCGMTKAGVSQAVSRGTLDPADLVSVAAFLARYGQPDVRMEILSKMIGLDRQIIERGRPQSTVGIARTHDGKLEEPSPGRKRRKAKPNDE